MKRNLLILVSFFFLMQYSFAQSLTSTQEEDASCQDNSPEYPVEKKQSEQVFDQASFWTVCIAASTVALPLTRSILASNFAEQSSFRYQVICQYEQHPPSYSSNSTTQNIPSHHLFTAPNSLEVETPYGRVASRLTADDIQIDYRACLNFDFFKHRFSRPTHIS